MKRFLKYSILFLLPIMSMGILFELLLRQIPNTYKYKYEWMQKNAKDVEILILGSSHALNGIQPSLLNKKAFNLANAAQGVRQDLYLLEYWGDEYTKLKIVILPISVFSWFYCLEDDVASYRCRYYKIYMDCDLYPTFSLYNLAFLDRGTATHFPALFQENYDIGCDQYGWAGNKLINKNYDAWNIEESVAAARHHILDISKHLEYNKMCIMRIADFCKNRNIKLILITTPCWSVYYNEVAQKQLDKMYELTNALRKEYNLQYFDYLKDDRFIAEDFSDCNHLSDVGAKKFTKILRKDLDL